jgi:hypothetical protein
MSIKSGELALRELGGVDLGGVFEFEIFLLVLFWFWFFFSSSLSFWLGLLLFVSLLVLRLFLLLDDLLEIFLGFWSSSCASWGLRFELQTLCFLLSMDSSRGEWEIKWSVPYFYMWWVIDTPRFEFESRTFPWFCYITFVCMENHVCLSRGVQVTGAIWQAMTRIVARVGDLVQRTGDDQEQVGYLVVDDQKIRWRRVWSTMCTSRWGAWISWLSLKTKVDSFPVWVSKPTALV